MPNLRPGLRAAAISLAAAGAVALAGCATQPGPYGYSRYEAGTIARVEEGTIVSVRPVAFGQNRGGSGALIGGAAGAAVGSQFGGDTGGAIAGAFLGGIAGAVAGDAIQRGGEQRGFAYTIRRDYDGSMFEVAQADIQPLPVGIRVHVSYGDIVRVSPAGY